MNDAVRLLIVAVLILGNAFFVIAEYAIVTARRGRLNAAAEEGSAGAQAALRLMDDPVRVISTVQVGITAIGILTGAVGESAIRDVLGDGIPTWLSFVIAFSAVTYLSVVFGELVPKALALEAAERIAILIARPIELIGKVLAPLVWLLQGSAAILLRPFGIREVMAGEGVRTPEELRAIVDEAEGSGVIPRSQEALLENVFDFTDHDVVDVMVPAFDVAWLDAELTPGEALDRIVASRHTRYPVARGTLDRVIGIVHARDVAAAVQRQADGTLGTLVRPAMMVPPTKPLMALLREMRETRQQVAIVLNEYGGTIGIATLEDLIEEIVGDIDDEHDLPRSTIAWQDDRTAVVAGATSIDDLNAELGTELPHETARTIGGLLLDRLGRRPAAGDAVELDGVSVRARRVEHARVVEVAIELDEPPPAAPAG